MKTRWREHEAVLITIIALIIIAGYIRALVVMSPEQMSAIRAAFAQHDVSFNYFTRILLPQIGCIIILWLAYRWINKGIIRQLTNSGKNYAVTLLMAVLQLLVICYVLGPGINFISYYSIPFGPINLVFYFPIGFGGHPQPFLNNFGGFQVGMFLVGLYLIYALFREITIRFIEKAPFKASYYILICNQATMTLVPFFALPIFTSVFKLVSGDIYYQGYFAFVLPALLIFITNTYGLFPRSEGKPLFRWQFAGPLLFTTFIYTFVFSIFLGPEWSWILVLCFWVAQVAIVTPLSWIDYRQRKGLILHLRGVEAALVKSNANLQFLRSQINPHFLFNALNTLYGTALIEGSKNTAEGIQKLGDMMRFMLHDNGMDFIPLEKEVEYLKNYISLQKLRTQLSKDIVIEEDISEADDQQAIAPMLLIPFVENAFKHGISLTEKSWIKIKLAFDAEHIFFEVRNTVHPSLQNDPEKDHSGIGLKNVQERLQLLYPGKHQFTYGKEGGEFVAKLTLNKINAVKRTVKMP